MTSEARRRKIVLVVDDSPDTLRLLTDALDSAEMTVMVALDGAAALRIVEQVVPDVILLDAVMPGLDGFETCRRLKREARLADVPVIFMTGLSETEHIVRGLASGGVDYVTKPVIIAEMLARIRVHLANARLTQSARAALDVSGRQYVVVDPDGAIIWTTPRASATLSRYEHGEEADGPALPTSWRAWIKQTQGTGDASRPAAPSAMFGDEEFDLQFVARLRSDELLLRLSKGRGAEGSAEFSRELGLTARESEVLTWLSKGKANKDIAQILGLSPRTVDKHLEQIYAKLGVENRTAATAIAVKAAKDGKP